MLTFADLFEALTGTRLAEALAIFSEAAIDSRQVIPAGLFVALPGERVDGHDFVGEAFKKGASAALVQNDLSALFPQVDLRAGELPQDFILPKVPFCILVQDTLLALQTIAGFWRRQLDVRVIGITGSVGKSTTKEMVTDVLSVHYRTLKNPGNLNNEIGLPLSLLRLGRGYQRAVLEMGFYVPGEIAFLCKLALPQVGIITNIGTVHAERAGSQEAIARGKSELIKALPPAPDGTAILNMDDPWVKPMKDLSQARIFYYGLDPHSDLWADQIESQGLEGIRLRLHYQGETLSVRVPVIGRHSAHTVLRAASAGLVEGLNWDEIIHGLSHSHSQLRLVAVRTNNGALVLDDTYNASPESSLAALNLLADMEGRRIAVLGDMRELGPYEKRGHAMVGIRAAETANVLVAVGKCAKQIAESAQQAGMNAQNIHWVENSETAIPALQNIVKSGDVVLVKGSHSLHMEHIVSALEGEE